MEFVVVNTNNQDHINKINEFCNNVQEQSDIVDFMQKIERDNALNHSNSIQEMIISIVGQKINNLCMLYGTRDNKLVNLKIINLKNGMNEKNKDFIHFITNYSFDNLGAETIVIYSEKEDKSLEMAGYESLGGINDSVNAPIAYIKDREHEKGSTGRKAICE